jgi:hypothetical protein
MIVDIPRKQLLEAFQLAGRARGRIGDTALWSLCLHAVTPGQTMWWVHASNGELEATIGSTDWRPETLTNLAWVQIDAQRVMAQLAIWTGPSVRVSITLQPGAKSALVQFVAIGGRSSTISVPGTCRKRKIAADGLLGGISVVASTLALSSRLVRCAVDDEEASPNLALSGMKLSLERSQLFLAATDSHRVSVCCIGGTCHLPASTLGAIVPSSFARALSSLCPDSSVAKPGHVCLDFCGHDANVSHVVARASGIEFRCVTMAGRFPDWERLFPMAPGKACVINAGDLLKALNAARPMLTPGMERLRLTISGSCIRVASESNGEEMRYEHPGEMTANDSQFLQATMNPTFLVPWLRQIPPDQNVECVAHEGNLIFEPATMRTGSLLSSSLLVCPIGEISTELVW